METTLADIPFEQLAQQLKLSPVQIQNAVGMLEEGWSIPFLAQYRLDHTDGASERVLSRLARELSDIRQLQQRKSSLVEYLRSRGELPPEMELEIQSADSREQIEHLHAIFKRNRQPKAMLDRNEAIESLVGQVLDGSISAEAFTVEVEKLAAASPLFSSAEDVSTAVCELVVMRFAQSLPVRQLALEIIRQTGSLSCRRYQAGDDGSTSEPAEPAQQTAKDPTPPPDQTPAPDLVAEGQPGSGQPLPTDSDPHDAADQPADVSTAAVPTPAAAPQPDADVPPSTASSSVKPPAKGSRQKNLSLAEQRRQRRKESRLRRRAHLESLLKDYFGTRISLPKLTASQFADIDYGERVRVLTAELEFDRARLDKEAAKLAIPAGSPHQALIDKAWKEALDRLIIPDCERIVRRHLSAQVEQQGVTSIKRRVRNICMQRPIFQPILAVAGHRDGFSVAVIDGDGQTAHSEDLLRNDYGPDKIKQRIAELVQQHAVSVMAIADGPRTRLIEQLATDSLGNELQEKDVGWFVVASDGLENFCKTAVCCEEIPNVSPEQRVAIALGRRAQNPLLEFVKCAPRDWLTEKQLTIVDVNRLSDEISLVYQSCLARVGVDVNHATAAVFRQVPGLDESIAQKMVARRKASGPIKSLSQFDELSKLSPRVQVEVAGFLRISVGDNPLDAMGIHPDHHDAASKVLKRCDFSIEMLAERVVAQQQAAAGNPHPTAKNAAIEWNRALRAVNVSELSGQVGVGKEQLKRIVNELCFAGRDVRMNSLLPVIRHGGFKMAEIKPGDLFAGRVVNVANFGAFVEIAHGVTGLLHISRLGDRYVRDPRELVTAGEILPVWIVSIDREKQRIALSISPPKPAKPPADRGSRGPRSPRKASGRPEPRRPRKTEYKPRPPRKSKPVVPITDEMKTGAAPMRTFGDLKQFFEMDQQGGAAAKASAQPHEAAKKSSRAVDGASQDSASQDSASQDSTTKNSDTTDSANTDSDPTDSDPTDSDTQDSDTQDSATQDSATQDSATQERPTTDNSTTHVGRTTPPAVKPSAPNDSATPDIVAADRGAADGSGGDEPATQSGGQTPSGGQTRSGGDSS